MKHYFFVIFLAIFRWQRFGDRNFGG